MPAHTGARSTGQLAHRARENHAPVNRLGPDPAAGWQRGWERVLRFTYRRKPGGVVNSRQGTRYTT
jgi:hypothetical protein